MAEALRNGCKSGALFSSIGVGTVTINVAFRDGVDFGSETKSCCAGELVVGNGESHHVQFAIDSHGFYQYLIQ